jgi:hypothetical protein
MRIGIQGALSGDGYELGFRPMYIPRTGLGEVYTYSVHTGSPTVPRTGLGAPDMEHGVEVWRLLALLESAPAKLASVRTCGEALEALAEIAEINGMIKGNLFRLTDRQNAVAPRWNAANRALAPFQQRLWRCINAAQRIGTGLSGPPRAPAVFSPLYGRWQKAFNTDNPTLGRAGDAGDQRVCDEGSGQVIRLMEVARRVGRPQLTAAAQALYDQWSALEERRQRGARVCHQMAALGRNAEQLARFIAAGG